MTTANTSVRLTPDEQKSLNELAGKSGCTMRNGKPSWRKLLQRLAAGEFNLVRKFTP